MILEVKNIYKNFCIERGFFKQKAEVCALKDVSLCVSEFETLGIVGESGSGKTTLAKIITKLIPQTSGSVTYNADKIKDFKKDVQIVFQNPYNSLDPKMAIIDAVTEPLIIHKMISRHGRKERALELLNMVGLNGDALYRYPIEFSGGQRQRICIARAICCKPKFIIFDEPISSLDLTIQAQMLDLFLKLKETLKLTNIFISHNLAVIKHIADSVIVLYNGQIVEQGKCEDIFNNPQNQYTKLLLMAAKQ